MRLFHREKTEKASMGPSLETILFYCVLAGLLFYMLLAGGAFRTKHVLPYDFPGSVWESEDPQIILHVVDGFQEHANATLVLNDKEIPVIIYMDTYDMRVGIWTRTPSELVLMGTGRFSSDKVTIQVERVENDYDTLYDGELSKIVLRRTDVQ